MKQQSLVPLLPQGSTVYSLPWEAKTFFLLNSTLMPWCRVIEKASKPFLSFGINIKALPVDFNVPVMVEGRGDCNQEEKAEALCKEGWAGCHTGCHYCSKCILDDQVLGLATGESWSCLWKRLSEALTQSLTVFPQLRLEWDNRHTSADDCFGLYWKQVFIVHLFNLSQ